MDRALGIELLALGRMYLEYLDVFRGQIVVPLDAHLDLYRALRQNADELGDEVSLKRTDFSLLDLDSSRMTITANLMEVKCYQQAGGLAGLNSVEGFYHRANTTECRMAESSFIASDDTPGIPVAAEPRSTATVDATKGSSYRPLVHDEVPLMHPFEVHPGLPWIW